jgi:hypothetical protein
LAIADNHLFAVDETAGRIQVFDLSQASTFNTDLTGYAALRRGSGYKGFFGRPPMVNFDDKTNKALQQQVKDGSIIPGQANPPGYFCSPDAIAGYFNKESGETYLAIADQCNYRLAVYRLSDVRNAMSHTISAGPGSHSDVSVHRGKSGKKKSKKRNP